MPAFVLLRLRISHTNRYAVVGVMPVFVLLCTRICHTNRYVVASVMPAFVLLCPHICHTNRSAIDGITPLICAWIVMNCLLSRTLYIIRCIAISNEMVFVDRMSNIQTYKPTLG